MLNENDVIAAVVLHLEARRWSVTERRHTSERGVDVLARKGTRELRIEAKGATSARLGSARYGRPFDSAQAFVHVAEAFFVAATVADLGLSAIALPDDELHRQMAGRARTAIQRLRIGIFWVRSQDQVRLEARWRL